MISDFARHDTLSVSDNEIFRFAQQLVFLPKGRLNDNYKKREKNSVRLSVLRGEKTAITKKRKPKKHPSPVFRTLRFSQRTKYHLTFFTVLIMLLSMK